MDEHTERQSGRQAVRVGIVQDGRLVEERLIVVSGDVLVGSDARCAIILPPLSAVPRAVALLVASRGGIALQLRDGMTARVSSRPGEEPAAIAGRLGTTLRVPLDDGARGRVVLGEVIVLFQVVRAPAAVARPTLPPSLHDSLVRQLDWWMVGTAGASFLAHALLMIVFSGYDPPRSPRIDEIPVRSAQWLEHWPAPRPIAAPPQAAGAKVGDPKPRHVTVGHVQLPTPDPRALAAMRNNAVEMALVGVKGGGGAFRDLLRNGRAFDDAERALGEASNVEVATVAPGLSPRGGSTGVMRGIDGLRGPTVGEVDVGKRGRERGPRCPDGLCDPDPPVIDGCDPGPLAGEVKQHRHALVACYERVRKHDPSVAGKVRLTLTIGKAGRVTGAAADPEGLSSDELVQCIESSARRWIFSALDACDEVRLSQELVFTPAE